MLKMLCGALLASMAWPLCLASQTSPVPPAYQELRWDENWSYLHDPTVRSDFFDPVKYIRLNDPGWFMSIGGEARIRYEFFRNASFGSAPNTPHGFLIQRYLLHSDMHLGPHVRVFVQLQSGLESGRVGGPRPTDKDNLEIHQGFVDLSSSADPKAMTLRLGRQELEFGSGRYLSASEVFNVRRGFDAARLIWHQGRWTWNALVARPDEVNPGSFDDSPDHRQSVWAAGAFGPNPLIREGNISLYYLGYDHKQVQFDHGAGRETRHTIGSRVSGKRKKFDYNYEILFQGGGFAGGNILALGIATETSYSLPEARFSPRFGIRWDSASGDRNPNGKTLGTFNPLFPTTAYSGKIGLIGASNVIDATPNFRFRLSRQVYFVPECSFFWRESIHDGIYSVVGSLYRTGRQSAARFIGAQVSLPVQIQLERHLSYTALVSRFFAGQYHKETPPGRSVTYFTNFVTYRF
jgi:hypothetical protein